MLVIFNYIIRVNKFYHLFLASLLNIFKELETDIPGFEQPKHGHLVGWAKQGRKVQNSFSSCKTCYAHLSY